MIIIKRIFNEMYRVIQIIFRSVGNAPLRGTMSYIFLIETVVQYAVHWLPKCVGFAHARPNARISGGNIAIHYFTYTLVLRNI